MCRAKSIHVVSESVAGADTNPQADYIVTHEVYRVQSTTKGIYVDLNISYPSLPPSSQHLRFEIDSDCLCNTIHVSDLNSCLLPKLILQRFDFWII